MAETSHFASALQTWCNTHENVSLRTIALEAETSNLSQYRAGTRSVTYDVIAKLLPVIERHSSRASAVTLLIAYLTDETPTSHADSISIQPVDATGQISADTYSSLAQRWEAKARLEPDFFAMWQGMDLYMHTPEILIDRHSSEKDIALLSETPAEYKFTPKPYKGSHPHDTIRTDAMPSQHVAQEHEEP